MTCRFSDDAQMKTENAAFIRMSDVVPVPDPMLFFILNGKAYDFYSGIEPLHRKAEFNYGFCLRHCRPRLLLWRCGKDQYTIDQFFDPPPEDAYAARHRIGLIPSASIRVHETFRNNYKLLHKKSEISYGGIVSFCWRFCPAHLVRYTVSKIVQATLDTLLLLQDVSPCWDEGTGPICS